MLVKNKKGFTLVEMVITFAIVAIISPLIFFVFSYGVDVFHSYDRFVVQENAVLKTMEYIRRDLQDATTVSVPSNKKIVLTYIDRSGVSRSNKEWEIRNDNALYYLNDLVVQGIDYNSSSIQIDRNRGVIIISIMPTNTNDGKNKARNMNRPIITELSVRYKG